MTQSQRSSLVVGVLLVLAGLAFAALQFFPGIAAWVHLTVSWPLIVIAVGVGLLILGLLVGAPDMAIPACIVAGIGAILYYQNLTGQWGTWAYAWALIPGFAGVGILLAGLLGGQSRSRIREGLDAILTSLVLFVIFGAFFGAFNGVLGIYWPLLLVGAGLIILVRNLVRH